MRSNPTNLLELPDSTIKVQNPSCLPVSLSDLLETNSESLLYPNGYHFFTLLQKQKHLDYQH